MITLQKAKRFNDKEEYEKIVKEENVKLKKSLEDLIKENKFII